MNTRANRRLNRRLWRAFLLQIVVISATAIVGVYLAEFAIRELLIVSALKKESGYFWARRNIEGDTAAPNTHALIGYLFDVSKPESFPEEFKNLNLGIHELNSAVGRRMVHVSQDNDERLILIFDADNVRELATYFGVVPLALMLIVLYSSAWFAYRISRRAVSPLIRLARGVRNVDVESDDSLSLPVIDDGQGADDEVITLSHALHQLVERINKFVERERSFTREASHELRSPLTVIRIASDLLLKKSALDQNDRKIVEKINRAAKDMEELTDTLLLLAREHETGIRQERFRINDLIEQEISRCELVFANKSIDLEIVERGDLYINGSPKVLAVVLGNLIRNACAYTERGGVTVTVADRMVEVADSGIGIDDAQIQAVFEPYVRGVGSTHTGHGIGLSLVKRLTDRFDWPLNIDSRPGTGTTVLVSFPSAEFKVRRMEAPANASAG